MKFFHKIYEFSINPKLSHRIIFWGTLTILNAIIGLMLSGGMDKASDIMGKIFGIGTWIVIYVWFLAPRYIHHANSILRTSIFSAYIAKTLSIIFYPIVGMLDIFLGLTNTTLVNRVLNKLNSFSPVLYEALSLFNTYLLTIMHGFELSLITLMLGYLIYGIRTRHYKASL